MRTKQLVSATLLALPFLLAGCSSTYKASGDHSTFAGAEDPYATTSGAGKYGKFDGKDLTKADVEKLNHLVYYFDFDRSDIPDDLFPVLRAHARYLSKHPNARIRIEGHTDERGSREYNVALGERRAKAINRVLLLEGAGKDQVDVVSYGEEKPAMQGHDEGSWKYNRRGVIVYEKTS